MNDRELIASIKSDKENAFRRLVEQHKQAVYYLSLSLTGNHSDAEDLSQEVFIKVYQSIEKFRMDAKIQTWLYRITVNAFIDRKRKKVLTMTSYHEESNANESTDKSMPEMSIIGDPERQTQARQIQTHIKGAMKHLSPKEKSAFVLRHYHDQPLKEIARLINVSEGTVKSLLFRAVKKMQKHLFFYKKELGLES